VGLVVGTVTTTANPASVSSIEYAPDQQADAERLAAALLQTPLLTAADVPEITLVLGESDPSLLTDALAAFSGLPCAAATPAG